MSANDEPTDAPAPAPAPDPARAADPAPPGDPDPPLPERELVWAPPQPRRPPDLAGWALLVAVTGLLLSFVIGWGFPVGVIAIITAAAALRRPRQPHSRAGTQRLGQSRSVAAWALALGILSLVYSALWIAVALARGPLF